MNFELPNIPERDAKPRKNGLTMMMDKGLSWRQAENFVDANAHLTDLVKLGFGTSYVTKDFQRKIDIYKEGNLNVYLGGTLFEARSEEHTSELQSRENLVCRLRNETIK